MDNVRVFSREAGVPEDLAFAAKLERAISRVKRLLGAGRALWAADEPYGRGGAPLRHFRRCLYGCRRRFHEHRVEYHGLLDGRPDRVGRRGWSARKPRENRDLGTGGVGGSRRRRARITEGDGRPMVTGIPDVLTDLVSVIVAMIPGPAARLLGGRLAERLPWESGNRLSSRCSQASSSCGASFAAQA